MDQLLQHILNAIVLGGTYALLGIGLTLIFGIMRVVNFTHGELYAFGGYAMYLLAATLGMQRRVITTGGSQSPDQLIDQAGAAVNGTMHLTFFAPWVPEATSFPDATKSFLVEWKKRGLPFAGVTESFRGYDGIRTIAAAIEKAGKPDPEAIRAAFWQVEVNGLNGRIKFTKAGPAGQESGQSIPNVYLIRIEAGKVILPQI